MCTIRMSFTAKHKFGRKSVTHTLLKIQSQAAWHCHTELIATPLVLLSIAKSKLQTYRNDTFQPTVKKQKKAFQNQQQG